MFAGMIWRGAAGPQPRRRDLNLDSRQGVSRVTLHRYGTVYHDLSSWLVHAGLPSMSYLAGGDLEVVSEVLTAYLQHMYSESLPCARAPCAVAAV